MSYQKCAYVYILTNVTRKVIYVGVTSDLAKRIDEHKKKLVRSFTNKYNCHILVYYEETESIESAIEREKQIKSWSRIRKEKLVEGMNPNWDELHI